MVSILDQALTVAQSQIGVQEHPKGSNRGPEVDVYLRSVGLDPTHGSYAWCAAFVFWCYAQAAGALGIPNPVIRTAGTLDHWNRAKTRVNAATAISNPALIKPGHIFIMNFGHGAGHTGIVQSVDPATKRITTVEGNTNDDGSREGYEVAVRTRQIASVVGFIDYSAPDGKAQL